MEAVHQSNDPRSPYISLKPESPPETRTLTGFNGSMYISHHLDDVEVDEFKIEILADAKPIQHREMVDLLKKFKGFRDNLSRIEYLAEHKSPYLFSSTDLIQLMNIVSSVRTRLSIVSLIGPRLIDPSIKSNDIINMFEYANEREKVENVLKKRSMVIQSSRFSSGFKARNQSGGRVPGLSPARGGPSGRRGSGPRSSLSALISDDNLTELSGSNPRGPKSFMSASDKMSDNGSSMPCETEYDENGNSIRASDSLDTFDILQLGSPNKVNALSLKSSDKYSIVISDKDDEKHEKSDLLMARQASDVPTNLQSSYKGRAQSVDLSPSGPKKTTASFKVDDRATKITPILPIDMKSPVNDELSPVVKGSSPKVKPVSPLMLSSGNEFHSNVRTRRDTWDGSRSPRGNDIELDAEIKSDRPPTPRKSSPANPPKDLTNLDPMQSPRDSISKRPSVTQRTPSMRERAQNTGSPSIDKSSPRNTDLPDKIEVKPWYEDKPTKKKKSAGCGCHLS